MSRLNRLLPVIGGAVAGGLIAWAVASGTSNSSTTRSVTTTVVRQAALPTSVTTGRALTINQIYRQASPGVVDITVTTNGGGGFPFGGSGQSQGEGAGVVYDSKGDILTDEHVVSGASSVTVKFQDGRKASAKVLGTDSSTDVAVIRVNVPASELHPIPFADSSMAQVGDPVVAIGSPFSLPETVTSGIVSAVGRSIQAPNNFTIAGAIQTDAPINPGNSGGPLLDGSGHVLGLNDQIQTNSGSSAGVGFAVPSNTVARIANAFIGGRSVKHSYVGVELNPSSSGGAQIASSAGATGQPPVVPGSPAANAVLKPGDLITAINGKSITSTEQFIATVDGYPPGQKVTLTIKSGGQARQVQLTLGTRPKSSPSG
jgi:putative serine protease PepD